MPEERNCSRCGDKERLSIFKSLGNFCMEVDIKPYGGRDVKEIFESIWLSTLMSDISKVSFIANGRKVTIEKIKE
jgi:hypothetical protein